jgi:hypothetical protein
MKEQTKDQIIAAQAAAIENLNRVVLNSLRERDNARAAIAAIAGSKVGDVQRLRLATLAFPQYAPTSISWDDLAQYFDEHEHAHAEEDSLKTAVYIAKQNEIDPLLSLPELIEAFRNKLFDAGNVLEELVTISNEYDVNVTDPKDVRVLQDAIQKRKQDEVRAEAWNMLANLGCDVRSLRSTNLPLDDQQIVFALNNTRVTATGRRL